VVWGVGVVGGGRDTCLNVSPHRFLVESPCWDEYVWSLALMIFLLQSQDNVSSDCEFDIQAVGTESLQKTKKKKDGFAAYVNLVNRSLASSLCSKNHVRNIPTSS